MSTHFDVQNVTKLYLFSKGLTDTKPYYTVQGEYRCVWFSKCNNNSHPHHTHKTFGFLCGGDGLMGAVLWPPPATKRPLKGITMFHETTRQYADTPRCVCGWCIDTPSQSKWCPNPIARPHHIHQIKPGERCGCRLCAGNTESRRKENAHMQRTAALTALNTV